MAEDRYRTLLDAFSAVADQRTVKAVLQSLRGVLSNQVSAPQLIRRLVRTFKRCVVQLLRQRRACAFDGENISSTFVCGLPSGLNDENG